MILVNKSHITGLRVGLKHSVTCRYPRIDFLLILKQAGCLKAPEITDGMTILSTIELIGLS